MQTISIERANFAQIAVVSGITLAALVLLGMVLAYWTWTWLAPPSESRAQLAEQTSGRVEDAHGLFGYAKRNGNIAAPTGIAIKLIGVIAATGGRWGYAMVQLEAKGSLAVREGDDISPGIRLAEVASDHVILERGGIRETLAWPEKIPSTETAVPGVGQ